MRGLRKRGLAFFYLGLVVALVSAMIAATQVQQSSKDDSRGDVPCYQTIAIEEPEENHIGLATTVSIESALVGLLSYREDAFESDRQWIASLSSQDGPPAMDLSHIPTTVLII